MLFELLGIAVSLGAISAMEARVSQALESATAEAQEEVERAEVFGRAEVGIILTPDRREKRR